MGAPCHMTHHTIAGRGIQGCEAGHAEAPWAPPAGAVALGRSPPPLISLCSLLEVLRATEATFWVGEGGNVATGKGVSDQVLLPTDVPDICGEF